MASQGWIEAFVTGVTAVTGNLSPIFPVTPVIAVTGIAFDIQLASVPCSAARDVDAEFIQAGSVPYKFL